MAKRFLNSTLLVGDRLYDSQDFKVIYHEGRASVRAEHLLLSEELTAGWQEANSKAKEGNSCKYQPYTSTVRKALCESDHWRMYS